MLQSPRPRAIFCFAYRLCDISKHLLCLAKKVDKNDKDKNLKGEFHGSAHAQSPA